MVWDGPLFSITLSRCRDWIDLVGVGVSDGLPFVRQADNSISRPGMDGLMLGLAVHMGTTMDKAESMDVVGISRGEAEAYS
jgi:hypothetical protein